MIGYMREGWKEALRQPFLLVILFLYRMAWGLVLYHFVQSIVTPLLHRYPMSGVDQSQTELFLAESQFLLMKTDISRHYFWLLAGLLGIRMLLTPLLNAGIWYSLSRTDLNSGYRFFKGMKELAKSFTLLYAAQLIVTFGPIAALVSGMDIFRIERVLSGSLRQEAWLLAVCLVYGFLVRLLFLHLQFGRTATRPLLQTAGLFLRRFLPAAGTAVMVLAATLLVSAAVLAATMIWAGFWALLLYQAYGLLRTVFSLWSVTAQRRLFEDVPGR
jgi:hypothetical protein